MSLFTRVFHHGKRKPAPTRSAQVFKQMSTNDSTSDPDEPKVSASAIVCEFTTYKLPFGKGRMILDPEAGVIYFKKCFVPYGFLTRKVRGWYACELSDIQSILLAVPMRGKGDYSTTHEYLMKHGEWVICIDTVHGKVEWITCMMNDETWRVGKYLEEYIRCQEKESPLSRLKTTSADFLTWADVRTGNFAPFVKMFFFCVHVYIRDGITQQMVDRQFRSLPDCFRIVRGFYWLVCGIIDLLFFVELVTKKYNQITRKA